MNKRKPKQKVFFSIITCTLDSDKYLNKNIKSVENQTFSNYEHIFIDGGSKDQTIALIDHYKLKMGSKVKLIHKLQKGISRAFNVGVDAARGEYLIFLNSDDFLFDRDVLKDVNEYLKSTNIDWIYGKINVIEDGGKTVGTFPSRKIFQISSRTLLKYINYIPHQAAFIRRVLFNKFGYFDNLLKSSMDYDYWLRISEDTKWKYFNRIISNYTIRTGSGSSDNSNKYLNIRYFETVQQRYLDSIEMIPARIVNRIVMQINKTYR